MQGNNPGQNGSGGNSNKQGSGLSWTTPSPATNSTSPLLGGAKPAVVAAAKPTTVTPAAKPVSSIRKEERSEMGRGTIAGAFIGGVIVGGLLVGGWYALTPSSAPVATNTTAGTNTGTNTGTNSTGSTQTGAAAGAISTSGSVPSMPAVGTANNLTVSTPQNAGSEVVIASATVSAPTWIAVYELSQGKPVRALGAKMFFPENNGKGGVIRLLRPTQANTAYFVGQVVDDGDHVYEPHVDKEVLDSRNNFAGATLRTQ